MRLYSTIYYVVFALQCLLLQISGVHDWPYLGAVVLNIIGAIALRRDGYLEAKKLWGWEVENDT